LSLLNFRPRIRWSRGHQAEAWGDVDVAASLIRKVDCVGLPVTDLDAALAFYSDGLGHELIWRTPTAAGLRLPECNAELVLHTEGRPPEVDLAVESVPKAIEQFKAAGGELVSGPFEIRIGKCAIVADPWGNQLVLLDQSKGSLRTDGLGNVLESAS
jgi:lactoylglutathione lyase